MKCYLTFICLTLSAAFGFSQDYIDVLKVHAGTTAPNSFDTGGNKTRINEFVADLSTPVKINDRSALVTGLIYESFNTRLFSDGNMERFGSATIKLGMNRQINERWSGTAVLLPKVASNHLNIGNKDFQLGAVAIMKYQKSKTLNYKFGLYYNSELFGPFFVPMAGLYYLSPNGRFEGNLMLPLQADANYKLYRRLSIGCNFNGQIRSYHLTNAAPGFGDTYLARATNEFYVYLKLPVSKNFIVQTKLGQSVGRSYRVYSTDDKVTFGLPALFIGGHRQQLNTDFSNGFIFQASLLYRVYLNK